MMYNVDIFRASSDLKLCLILTASQLNELYDTVRAVDGKKHVQIDGLSNTHDRSNVMVLIEKDDIGPIIAYEEPER